MKDEAGQAVENEDENENNGSFVVQQTVTQAAEAAEAAQEIKDTDSILAVLSFLPSHQDVRSLLTVFWRFHHAMLDTDRPQKPEEKVGKSVKQSVRKTVAGVADVGRRAEAVVDVLWRAEAVAEAFVSATIYIGLDITIMERSMRCMRQIRTRRIRSKGGWKKRVRTILGVMMGQAAFI